MAGRIRPGLGGDERFIGHRPVPRVFSRYILSGFGLLGGEVAFLTVTPIAIDLTLVGLFWALGGEDVLGRLIQEDAERLVPSLTSSATSTRSFARTGAGHLGIRADASGCTRSVWRRSVSRLVSPSFSRSNNGPSSRTCFRISTASWCCSSPAGGERELHRIRGAGVREALEFKLTTHAGFVLVPFAL